MFNKPYKLELYILITILLIAKVLHMLRLEPPEKRLDLSHK